MVELTHTPGPWHWSEDRWWGGYSGLYSGDTPVFIPQHRNEGDGGASWINTDGDAGEETLEAADATLIAAAPDLLEAAEAVQWSGGQDSHGCGICPSCDADSSEGHRNDCELAAAIKAAKGEA